MLRMTDSHHPVQVGKFTFVNRSCTFESFVVTIDYFVVEEKKLFGL